MVLPLLKAPLEVFWYGCFVCCHILLNFLPWHRTVAFEPSLRVSGRVRRFTEWNLENMVAGWWLEFGSLPKVLHCERGMMVHSHGAGSNCFYIADWHTNVFHPLQLGPQIAQVHSSPPPPLALTQSSYLGTSWFFLIKWGTCCCFLHNSTFVLYHTLGVYLILYAHKNSSVELNVASLFHLFKTFYMYSNH
jgi:hypothetical protein